MDSNMEILDVLQSYFVGEKKVKQTNEKSGLRMSLVTSDEEFNESSRNQSFRQDDRVLF